MSNDINSTTNVGRLTRDAEIKYTNAGMAVCKFSIASSSYAGKDKDDYTSYFDVVLWGKQGEAIIQYLTKGKQVAISGELRQNRWEQDGQKRNKVEIKASNVQLLSSDNKTPQSPQGRAGDTTQKSGGNSEVRSDAGFQDDIPF